MTLHSLLSAGSNARGQLATGDSEDRHNFTACSFYGFSPNVIPHHFKDIIQIACGSNHTLLLADTIHDPPRRELWGCGDGRRGQLGPLVASLRDPSTTLFRPLELDTHSLGLADYNPKNIATSWETSYVVFSHPEKNDVIVSFGANDYGNLGMGHTKSVNPVQSLQVIDISSAICEKHVESIHIEHIAAAMHHVVISLRMSNEHSQSKTVLVGWGASRHGQLGAVVASSKPVPNCPSPVIIPLQNPDSVISLSAGTHHTVVLHSSGKLSVLGSDRKGQIHNLDNLESVCAVGCTWNGTFAVVKSAGIDHVLASGINSKGQLGRTPGTSTHNLPLTVQFPPRSSTHKLIDLVCGSEHVLCSLAATDVQPSASRTELWGWGWNEHGNLALGHVEDVYTPTKLWPPTTETGSTALSYISAGCGTSWIVLHSV
ncbi:regulator of chromosome condensation 1/beta-lactamase-inhibitor protein II [Abortiporus biennis]|nr:regulator of chromosome condensation 1/beta-lactamase-inhibitor protein II [Abortiporus biennis]